ncbi:sugar O-acetyltransferase [Cognatiyoonia sp. IB215182]|uniref:sugar O-acetyltransferase n=1 Tax=Cognatiyoonia sp. IB215182 TaxID=3097353 RepID=UPI002A0AF2C5|nr:sugar O-acetyltransferase [Cognatiyoonia sp. IB215182]MDX8353313.1 sugar O-acetyltransferase [Cognatiyoonia sp. IB215182]
MTQTSQKDRMIAGELYRAGDPELVAARKRAQGLMRAYNQTVYGDDDARKQLLGALLGTHNGAVIRPPFYVDYGFNIHCGSGVFLNYGCVLLDVCPIHIGAGTQIGPGTQILTADHPRDPAQRAEGLEMGQPITIGANVWIGGGALLLPGVTIGDDAVVGAGAVVTRDVAAGQTVVGNPARPLASLD